MTQRVADIRMPSCIDVYGEPVKGCSQFFEDEMIDQGAQGGHFACSYHPGPDGPGEKVLSPGRKDVLEKNDLRYMNWAIFFWVIGACIIVLAMCLEFCCIMCLPPRRGNYLDEELEE